MAHLQNRMLHLLQQQIRNEEGAGRRRRAGVLVGGRKRVVKRRVGVQKMPSMAAMKSMLGGRRRVVRRRPAMMGMGGRRKKACGGTSPWISHVKRYAKAHGMSYGEAMSAARSSYRGGSYQDGY